MNIINIAPGNIGGRFDEGFGFGFNTYTESKSIYQKINNNTGPHSSLLQIHQDILKEILILNKQIITKLLKILYMQDIYYNSSKLKSHDEIQSILVCNLFNDKNNLIKINLLSMQNKLIYEIIINYFSDLKEYILNFTLHTDFLLLNKEQLIIQKSHLIKLRQRLYKIELENKIANGLKKEKEEVKEILIPKIKEKYVVKIIMEMAPINVYERTDREFKKINKNKVLEIIKKELCEKIKIIHDKQRKNMIKQLKINQLKQIKRKKKKQKFLKIITLGFYRYFN